MKHYICRHKIRGKINDCNGAAGLNLRSLVKMKLHIMFVNANTCSGGWDGSALAVGRWLMLSGLIAGLLELMWVGLAFFDKRVEELSEVIFSLSNADGLSLLIPVHGRGYDILCEARLGIRGIKGSGVNFVGCGVIVGCNNNGFKELT